MLYSKGVIMDKEFKSNFPQTVCALLPQIPNVRIKLFKITKHYHSNTIQKTAEYEEINRIINYETSNHETSTCFMLFCNIVGDTIAKQWASTIQKRYNLYLIQVIIYIFIIQVYSIANA